jgi:BASS family bile acid:Na+ symporter
VKDLILSIIKIGLPLTIMASMFAQGMSIVLSELTSFERRPLLMLRSLAVVLVVVPVAALVVVLALRPSAAVAMGIAILMASPAAPMMLVKVPKKGGSLGYLASLHLSLAILALVTVPLTVYLFSRALGFPIGVGELAVARVVGMTIVVPVVLGIAIRKFWPKVADAVAPGLAKVSKVVLLILVVGVVAMTFRVVLKMDVWSYVVMAIVVTVALAIGHLLGPRGPEERTTLAIESAARHPGLAMTIATLNFSPRQALPVLIPYLVVVLVITTVYLKLRRHHPSDASLDPSWLGHAQKP